MFTLSRESCREQLVVIDEEIAKLKERKVSILDSYIASAGWDKEGSSYEGGNKR